MLLHVYLPLFAYCSFDLTYFIFSSSFFFSFFHYQYKVYEAYLKLSFRVFRGGEL